MVRGRGANESALSRFDFRLGFDFHFGGAGGLPEGNDHEWHQAPMARYSCHDTNNGLGGTPDYGTAAYHPAAQLLSAGGHLGASVPCLLNLLEPGLIACDGCGAGWIVVFVDRSEARLLRLQ